MNQNESGHATLNLTRSVNELFSGQPREQFRRNFLTWQSWVEPEQFLQGGGWRQLMRSVPMST